MYTKQEKEQFKVKNRAIKFVRNGLQKHDSVQSSVLFSYESRNVARKIVIVVVSHSCVIGAFVLSRNIYDISYCPFVSYGI